MKDESLDALLGGPTWFLIGDGSHAKSCDGVISNTKITPKLVFGQFGGAMAPPRGLLSAQGDLGNFGAILGTLDPKMVPKSMPNKRGFL